MRLSVFIFALLVLSCEKQVDINDPYPIDQAYCEVDEELEGEWISDSVSIVTEVDTVDTLIVEDGATIIYYLNISCGETPSLSLFYYNYAVVETTDISSSNFEASDGTIQIFNAVDSLRQNADGMIEYAIDGGLLTLNFSQFPNSGQRTDYSIFMSPLVSAN